MEGPSSMQEKEASTSSSGGGYSKEELGTWASNKEIKKLSEAWSTLPEKLGTHVKNGLPQDPSLLDAQRAKYGENRMPTKEAKSFLSLFLGALSDRTLIILLLSACLSIVLGVYVKQESHGWIEGAAIIVAVLVVSSVTAGNDYSKERQFRKLNEKREERKVRLVRGGQEVEDIVQNVLVGDVIFLETGDKICADGIVLESNGMKCNESNITGESKPVTKAPVALLSKANGAGEKEKEDTAGQFFMLYGAQVESGNGKMLVLAVGASSSWGKMMQLLTQESDETPLQQQLEHLGDAIGKLGLGAATLTFFCLFSQWAYALFNREQPFQFEDLGELVNFLITSITIVVVAVPEGLPLAVTISLAYSVVQMMNDNNLVRHLAACETMGGADYICSDKTGTLTKNDMTVVQVYIGDKVEDLAKDANNFDQNQNKDILTEAIALNSTATLQFGNKTEMALLNFLTKYLKQDFLTVRKKYEIKSQRPFSSETKSMSTLICDSDKQYRLHVKGAPEIVLRKCALWRNEIGQLVNLDEDAKRKIEGAISSMANQAMRTIAVAYHDFGTDEPVNPIEDKLILIGICGIMDPPRDEVPPAVGVCQTAGIKVIMLTGDNIETAKAIAKKCNILSDGIAIEGPQFRNLSNEDLDKIIHKIQVMARSSPEDKYRLVRRLREHSHVVAVTGDGTNDAPQLKEADVGFAMGIAGTEVAKEAADIILLDDNFNSIVKAVKWGRNVYDSIRKFVQFQLTVNIVAVVVAFVGAFTNGESPLKPVQMLWVNLIMDTLAALALATERPTEELLQRKPRGRSESIVSPIMWRNIIAQAIFQLAAMFLLLYRVELVPYFGLPADRALWTEHDYTIHTTIIFNSFVLCQLFNEINSRKVGNEWNVFSGFFNNYIFLSVMGFTLAVQFLIIEFGGEFTETASLSLTQWLACLGLGAISIPYRFLLQIGSVLVPQSHQEVENKVPSPAPVLPADEETVEVKRQGLVQSLRKKTAVNAGSPYNASADQLAVVTMSRNLANIENKFGGIEGLASAIKTNLLDGLSSFESLSDERRKHFGVNIKTYPKQTFVDVWKSALKDNSLLYLLCAGVLSAYLDTSFDNDPQGFVEAIAIIASVMLVVTMTAVNDYRRERLWRAYNKAHQNRQIRVTRGGYQTEIPIFQVLVGDLVHLEDGDVICADGIVTTSHGLVCNEEIFEDSNYIEKSPMSFVYADSRIVSGFGTMLVLAVGNNTLSTGKRSLGAEKAYLNSSTRSLSDFLGRVGVVAAGLLFLVLVLKHVVAVPTLADVNARYLVNCCIVAIAVAVVAMPEGLPLAYNLSLNYSLVKLLSNNVLVRSISGFEALAGVKNICTSETGVITSGKYVVKSESSKIEQKPVVDACVPAKTLVAECLSLCSTAYIFKKDSLQIEMGNKMECAMLKYIQQLNIPLEGVKAMKDYTSFRQEFKLKQIRAFSAATQSMSVIAQKNSEDSGNHVFYIRGPLTTILEQSRSFVSAQSAKEAEFTKEDKKVIVDSYITNEIGQQAIGLAYKVIRSDTPTFDNTDSGLTFIAAITISETKPEAIEGPNKPLWQNAFSELGINVKFWTNGSLSAAENLADKIFKSHEGVKPADGLESVPAEDIKVLASSKPSDRELFIKRLRDATESCVAVVGESSQVTNADVKVSLAESSSEATNQAADIVMHGENGLLSLASAVIWSRTLYSNIRKFVLFQTTAALVTVVFCLLCAFFADTMPLKPVHLLWVNLIVDSFAAVALATEDPTVERSRSVKKNEQMVTPLMKVSTGVQLIFQIAILCMFQFSTYGHSLLGLPADSTLWSEQQRLVHSTVVFNVFVLLQLFNQINCRTPEVNAINGLADGSFMQVWLFSLMVQVFFVQNAGSFAQTISLTRAQWALCLQFTAPSLLLAFITKFLYGNPQAPVDVGFEPPVPSNESKQEDSWIWQVFSKMVLPAAIYYLLQFLLFVLFAAYGLLPAKILTFINSVFARQ